MNCDIPLRFRFPSLIIFLAAVPFLAGCSSQQPALKQNATITAAAEKKTSAESVTIEDYRRAEKFLWRNTYNLVLGNVSEQQWTADGKLMYSTNTAEGKKYMLADPLSGEKKQAFNHQKFAESLSQITDRQWNSGRLFLRNISFSRDGNMLHYEVNEKRYKTDLRTYKTSEIPSRKSYKEFLSPDGKKAAYINDHNLWIRNTETGERTQLTTDGKKDYGYATNNAGWIRSERPVLNWGPNSEKIATFRQDARGVGEMYLYNSKVGHSDLEQWKGTMPGDSVIFRIERVVIHLPEKGKKPKVVRFKMDADPQRSTTTDHIADYDGHFLDTEWADDGEKLAFVSVSRNHQVNQLRIADVSTGEVRDILTEKVDTYYESGYSRESWEVLEDSDEVIWFSERDNWGHLYLYDLKTGKLKNQIIEGNWRVLDLQYVDEENRTVYFTGSNRADGNPYYQYLYKVNMDGTGLVNLTPENRNHEIYWSPEKKYFTDTYSTPDTPPVSVIRNLDGDVVMELEKADITPLKNNGWVAPEQFTVKARDGETDLYGLMYKPSNFDSSKSYPVIDYVYPGPQTGSVGSRSFRASRYDNQALAELGFIVVEVDGMGTPGRSKSFHDEWYGNMGDNTIPDQVTMIRQLAERYSWMDTTRVGIWGHSGGGTASTRAILAYPDFFKVAVSESGNHDNRNYESDWGDKWQGLLKKQENVDPSTLERFEQGDNYDGQANQLLAENLKGHLLLSHGMMDANVPPTSTLLVAEALIRADKDFDMFMIPNAGHDYGYAEDYFMNRRWDYFVKHLKGAEPPAEFTFDERGGEE